MSGTPEYTTRQILYTLSFLRSVCWWSIRFAWVKRDAKVSEPQNSCKGCHLGEQLLRILELPGENIRCPFCSKGLLQTAVRPPT